MSYDNNLDAFTYHILKNIDSNILDSFSSSQLSSIKEAINASKPKKRHAVEIRGLIKLFFTHYYFVFLMGRD